MSIRNFSDLVETARKENQPNRLLFLFAKTEKMRGQQKTKHNSGTINPVMCVDKGPEELTSFEALLKEADSLSPNWDLVLIGALAGKNGLPPSNEEIDSQLHKMSNHLASGGDLSRYAVLDRAERPVIIS